MIVIQYIQNLYFYLIVKLVISYWICCNQSDLLGSLPIISLVLFNYLESFDQHQEVGSPVRKKLLKVEESLRNFELRQLEENQFLRKENQLLKTRVIYLEATVETLQEKLAKIQRISSI